MSGNISGSINIPLDELENSIGKIRAMKGTLPVCHLSESRSAQACAFLESMNIDWINVGSWYDLRAETIVKN